MDVAKELGYKPPSDFVEDKRDPLVELKLTDSTELWLIQWPINHVWSLLQTLSFIYTSHNLMLIFYGIMNLLSNLMDFGYIAIESTNTCPIYRKFNISCK